MFPGFTDRDFDAYAPNKWKSNVFNRERLEVKQKLVALGKELAGTAIAADGSPLTCDASAEHPALWNHKQVEAQQVFFSRNEGARRELDRVIEKARSMTTMLEDPTPQRNHVFLAVSLFLDRIDFALKLHPDARVDRQNLERKLAEPWERERFIEGVAALPEGYAIGVTGQSRTPCSALDDARLTEVLKEFALPEKPGATHWLVVDRQVPRAEAASAGTDLVARAKDELAALVPVYHFVAWSRDNDWVSMREQLKQEKKVERQKGLAKGDKVRIVRGMFAGRGGTIQEIDARGGMRVLVGKLAVKVVAGEVEKG
jgi:hypothetical protein